MSQLSSQTDPINISTVAKRVGVTRQSLYNNDLADVVAEFAALQRKNFSETMAAASRRRPLEDRIEALTQENEELKRKLDGWIERWVAIEYNARMLGIDSDALFAALPKPQREVLRAPSQRPGK
jgi:FtsZ-binding cell division protein ZapB